VGGGKELAEQFQKMIDHLAVVDINFIGALASLQLARAEVLTDDADAGAKAYPDVLTIWKDTDPDIPV